MQLCRPRLTFVQPIPALESLRSLQCADEGMQRRSDPVVSARDIAFQVLMPSCCARCTERGRGHVDSPILSAFETDGAGVVVGSESHEGAVEGHGNRHPNRHEDDHEQGCEEEGQEEFEHGDGCQAYQVGR